MMELCQLTLWAAWTLNDASMPAGAMGGMDADMMEHAS